MLSNILFPNIPLPVANEGTFWTTVSVQKGFVLQQHDITGHARILNSNNIRIAWGDLDRMKAIMKYLSKPWERCKKGDILAINRFGGIYTHFAVFVGGGKVIHYTGDSGDLFGENTCIRETGFGEFLRDDLIFSIVRFPENNRNFKTLYSAEETVKRARSRLGETKYNLAFNNCEHFALWCKTGVHESKQVENAIELLVRGMTPIPYAPMNIQ